MLRRLKCWIWFDSLDCLDCMQLVLCCNLVMNPVLLNESFFSLLFFFKMIFFYFSIGFWWCSFAFLFGPKLAFFIFYFPLCLSLFGLSGHHLPFFSLLAVGCVLSILMLSAPTHPQLFYTLSQQEISKALGFIEKWLR